MPPQPHSVPPRREEGDARLDGLEAGLPLDLLLGRADAAGGSLPRSESGELVDGRDEGEDDAREPHARGALVDGRDRWGGERADLGRVCLVRVS